jgi:hypothetical protein
LLGVISDSGRPYCSQASKAITLQKVHFSGRIQVREFTIKTQIMAIAEHHE